MTRNHLSKRLPAVAALAVVLAAPSAGLAQNGGASGASGAGGSSGSGNTGNINAQIIKIAGKSQDQQGDVFINLDNCVKDVDVEFRIDQFPTDKQLDIYVGSDCYQVTARDGEGIDCDIVLMGEDLPGTQDQRVTLKAAEMVNLALGTDDCGKQRSTSELWFLAVDMPGGNETLSGANMYGKVDLNIDTDPPDAPTMIKGGRGENEILVEWSVGGDTVESFEIFVDPGEGSTPIRDAGGAPPADDDGGTDSGEGTGQTNDMCGSGQLTVGGDPEYVKSLKRADEPSPTATSTTLSPDEIGADVAAVAVVAIDEADNKSPLSEVVCVYIVPTSGFKDLYEQENGEIPQGCPCAAAGPAQLEGALPIALALGAIAYRRRRRS